MNPSNGITNVSYIETENSYLSPSIIERSDQISGCENSGALYHIFPALLKPRSIDSQLTLTFGHDKPLSCSLVSASRLQEDPLSPECPPHRVDEVLPHTMEQLDDTNFRENTGLPTSVIKMMTPHSNSKYFDQICHTSSQVPSLDIVFRCDTDNESLNNYTTNSLGKQRLRKNLLLKGRKVITFCVKYAVTFPLIALAIWAIFYVFWGNLAFPGGALFSLLILEILSISFGRICELLSLPPAFGMLCAGLFLRNVPCINVATDLRLTISSPLRGISVVILLTRGAFSVNPANILKYKSVVPFLGIGSCLIEAAFGSVAAYFIIGFSPPWAALIGCIMSAMSGAIAMPYLLNIENHIQDMHSNTTRRARETLVIAKTACGLDAILAICMAEFAFGFIFGRENVGTSMLKGPAEVAFGGIFGAIWGGTSGVMLTDKYPSDFKIIAIFAGGTSSLIGLNRVGYPRGGPLACFLGTLVAVTIWRQRKVPGLKNLTQAFDKLWFVFQPLLFGILGARTDFSQVDWNLIYKGAICLGFSMTGRCVGSFLMTQWSGLSLKERLFLVVAWSGKGTVQAALGPVALDTSTDLGLEQEQFFANQIMNLSAMIIIMAVIGSLALKVFGPRILTSK